MSALLTSYMFFSFSFHLSLHFGLAWTIENSASAALFDLRWILIAVWRWRKDFLTYLILQFNELSDYASDSSWFGTIYISALMVYLWLCHVIRTRLCSLPLYSFDVTGHFPLLKFGMGFNSRPRRVLKD
jgi:hypothetical protein